MGSRGSVRLERVLTKTSPPIEIPPQGEFPRVGHIRRGEIPPFQAATNPLREKTSDSDLKELLDELGGWIATASDENLDLVLFYH